MRLKLLCAAVALVLACAADAQEKSQQNAADEAAVKGDLDAAKKSGDPEKQQQAEKILEQAAETAKNQTAAATPVQVSPQFSDFSDQQRRTIYDTVMREQPPASEIEQAEIGSALPPNVALHALPGQVTGQIPGASTFRYVRTGDRLLMVEPTDRVVVGILGQ